MKVSEILHAKGKAVVTVAPSDTIADLSQRLREKRIGAAVVSSDGYSIEGVISERDIAFGIGVHKAGMHALPVSELMTRTVITCGPGDDVGVVASMMLARNVRHIPVEDDGRLIGIVSIRDVLKVRVDELQQQAAMLRTAVVASEREPQDR